jgi:iron-sulfur cluster insertion protein
MDNINDTIIFTSAAANRARTLLEKENDPALNLRLFVQGGGCSGFQYGFVFDETINEDDTVLTTDGVKLLIDSASFQYLDGSTVDYEETIESSQFVIRNPQVKSQCGCGSSFSA